MISRQSVTQQLFVVHCEDFKSIKNAQIGAAVHIATYPAQENRHCVVTRRHFTKTNISPGVATGGKGKSTGATAPCHL